MSEKLQAAVQRVLAGSRDEADLMAIATAIQTGQVTWACGNGAVGVGGDVANSLIVLGSHNIIDSTIVLEGEAGVAMQALLIQRLGLTPTSVIPLDEMIQQVRSQASTKILNLFRKIQLLNKRQVEVDQLYVDVYVLEVRELRATIPGLLAGQDVREQFERIGLGTQGERSPGLAIAASKDFPQLIVLGKPGSGKSTFLRHLAVNCAKGEFLGEYIPVLLELRDVDEATFSLFQYLHGEFGLEQETQTEQLLKQGQLLLLLDGLDEVPSSLRQTVQHELRKFAKRYDKNRFILTCRTQTTEYIPEQFQAVEVADFKPEQVECFALHWFTAMAGTLEQGVALKNQFMEKLRESPQTAELAVTPVLLSLTCWIFDDMKGLPQKRSDLYRDGLDLLLQQWDEGRGISRDSGSDRYHQLTIEERKRLLSYVAVRKFEQAENFVLYEESELCGYIAEHLQLAAEESRAVLGAIAQQHGLLIKRAQEIWSFSHLTFQEYLVSRHIIKSHNPEQTFQNLVSITEEHWREIGLLTTEMLPSADQLALQMKNTIDKLLAQEPYLQQFLSWVYFKAESADVTYKPAAVRAMYSGFPLNWVDCGHLASTLSEVLDSSQKGGNLDDVFTEEPILTLDSTLRYALLIASYINDGKYGMTWALQAILQSILKHHPDLREEVKYLQPIVEAAFRDSEEDDGIWRQWWRVSGESVLAKLRATMIKYRNIGQDWKFTEEQMVKLQQYFRGNILLANCLQIENFTLSVRREIEETLLLPIAEIEKRKNQSSD